MRYTQGISPMSPTLVALAVQRFEAPANVELGACCWVAMGARAFFRQRRFPGELGAVGICTAPT